MYIKNIKIVNTFLQFSVEFNRSYGKGPDGNPFPAMFSNKLHFPQLSKDPVLTPPSDRSGATELNETPRTKKTTSDMWLQGNDTNNYIS